MSLVPEGRDEGGADAAALFGADRNVLQIGIGGGKPAGGGRGQRIARVHAAGFGIDVVPEAHRYRWSCSLESWRQSSTRLRQFNALCRQIIEHVRIGAPGAGRSFAPARQAHPAEQDIAQLLGRADIEVLAGERVDFRLDLAGSFARTRRKACASTARSTRMPSRSIAASTATSGRSSVS